MGFLSDPRRTPATISTVCTAILVAVAITVLAMQRFDPDALVRARAVVFTRYESPAAFDEAPAMLRQDGFHVDDRVAQQRLRDDIQALPGWRTRLDSLTRIADPLVRARAVVAAFSTYGTRSAECGTAARLIDRVTQPGCCSDHTEAFIALADVTGLIAREVHNDAHTVVEVWEPTARRWVLIDPMLGLFVRDGAGRRLSLSEMRAARLRGAPVTFESFAPTPLVPAAKATMVTVYDVSAFTHPRLTFGTNVLAEEALRQRLAFVPKAVARLVGYVLGITPGYRGLVDATNRANVAWLIMLRNGVWSLLVLLVAGAAAWPASALWAMRRRGRRPRRPRRVPYVTELARVHPHVTIAARLPGDA